MHDVSHGDSSFVHRGSSYSYLFTFWFREQSILHRNITLIATSLPAAPKQHTTVTSWQRSADTVSPTLQSSLATWLGSVVMPRLSIVKILFWGVGETWNLIFSNTAPKLSEYLVTWTLLKSIIFPKLHFSEHSDWQILSFANLTTQSFPTIILSFWNLWSVPFLSAYCKLDHRTWRPNLCSSQLINFIPHLKKRPWSDPETSVLFLCLTSFSGLIQALRRPQRFASCFLQFLDAGFILLMTAIFLMHLPFTFNREKQCSKYDSSPFKNANKVSVSVTVLRLTVVLSYPAHP